MYIERKKLSSSEIKKEYGEKISFQILEWNAKDIYDEESEEVQLYIYMFGNTEKGHSVSLASKGFEPHFYVKVKEDWKLTQKNKFLDALERCMGYQSKFLNKENCILVKRKIFYGFRGNDKDKFIKLSFKTLQAFYYARKVLSNSLKIEGTSYTFEKFEDKVDPILQFIHQYHIKSVGWVEFHLNKAERSNDTRTQIEYILDVKHLVSLDKLVVSPFLQMSYDIECYSYDPNKFPTPDHPENPVIQIGMTFQKYGELEFEEQVILTLKKCNQIKTKNTRLFCFENEKDLLLFFRDIINKKDPDIIYSYNGYRFDDSYLYKRAELLGIEKDFLDCSKFCSYPGKLETKTFSSSAYGTSEWNYFSLPGRLNFDLYVYINREFKLDSYSMDSVAKEFLSTKIVNGFKKVDKNKIYIDPKFKKQVQIGQILTLKDVLYEENMGKVLDIKDDCVITENETNFTFEEDAQILLAVQKNPVGPQMIFSYFKEGDPEKIKQVCLYCLQDTLIPLFLVRKLNIFLNQIQMALVTYVPFKFLLERGQQIKVYSQLLKETKKRNFLIPSIQIKKEGFEGATVLNPAVGAYFSPVVVLDFASLYPSIIRAHNFCYSSIVLNPKYDNLEGFEYKTISWSDEKGDYNYKFVQNTETILPDLLRDLINERKRVKKEMKIEKDEFKLMVLDGFQLALKISANSIYGFLTAQMLQCNPIGACVTAVGRQMISQTKNFVNSNYSDFETIYGDSVVGDTPITLKNEKGEVEVKYIKDLGKQWDDYSQFKPEININKEQSKIENLKVWSGSGWSPILRVIRHKTKKRIYRVRTNKGVVIITEDHSLFNKDKEQIKPEECIVGKTQLWHNDYN